MHNAHILLLLELDKKWTSQQRRDFGFLGRNAARELLVEFTGKDFGFSIWRWSLYIAIFESDWIVLSLLFGDIFGIYERLLISEKEGWERGDIS